MEKISIGSKPLIMPTPVMVVGSYDSNWKPNLATAAWGGVISHQPMAYVAVCFRPETYTHDSILCQGAFTVHFANHKLVKVADYVGIYSGRDEDKISKLGLNAKKSELVNAPIVEEFPLVLECKLYDSIRINRHTQFIGEVQDVKIQSDCLDSQGKIIVEKLQPIVYATNCSEYYALGEIVGQGFSIGKK